VAGSMKKVMIIGNVGQDPQTKYTPDGTPFASFSVAVNERPRRGQGGDQGQGGQQQEEQTTWFRVTAWRRQAEIVSQYVTKGTSIFVMGNLTAREFVGNDGQKRTSLDVTMDDMQLLTPRGAQEGGSFDEGGSFGGGQQGASRPSASYGGRPAAPSQPSGGRQQPDQGFGDDDDIPF
jgi:single-strand DNA-binding protein